MRTGIWLLMLSLGVPLMGADQKALKRDELAKPVDWPVITSQEAGIQIHLRTRWQKGTLDYVVKIVDLRGGVARYLANNPDTGTVARSSFQLELHDEFGFLLHTIHLKDQSLARATDPPAFVSTGGARCPEKTYRAALKALNASSGPPEDREEVLHILFPTELGQKPPDGKKW
jgi:hypothetical protein